jgi:hypothetical protein
MRAAGVAMGGGVLRACDAVLDLLQIGVQQMDQEMRQVVANRIEKRGRTRAHW